jgi:NarL family two-component system response regulator LiaR
MSRSKILLLEASESDISGKSRRSNKVVNKIRVFLADDHTVLREATAELVDHQPDMEVVGQAGSGEDTVALAKVLLPDVIVMDAAMPRLNGIDATRRIAAECPEIRVLVLSAHEDEEHVIPMLKAGATGYLPKTVSLNDLLEAIRATNRGISVLPPAIASIVVRHISSDVDRAAQPPITAREIEVLNLVAKGLTNDQIARQLHLSKRTIEAHLTHIFTKLNVFSRTEAVLLAQKRGWIKTD